MVPWWQAASRLPMFLSAARGEIVGDETRDVAYLSNRQNMHMCSFPVQTFCWCELY